ncbi:MAG TPA: DUF423 domain-containing protein [Saprospiraceae bacterium]|nr:DUF423 domain-containing protein [Saprospiraceae bacterium]
MKRRYTQMMAVACIVMVLAVAFGAFGAHALRDILGDRGTEIWTTASRYHFYHGLGMLVVLLLGKAFLYPRILLLAAIVLCLGTVCFSGSLYILGLRPEWTLLGPVTPIGGLLLLTGWMMCALAMVSYQAKEE